MKNKSLIQSKERRAFLKHQLTGALLFAAGAAGIRLPTPVRAAGAPDLAMATGRPGPAVRAGVKLLGGIRAFVKPGDKVMFKKYAPDELTYEKEEYIVIRMDDVMVVID